MGMLEPAKVTALEVIQATLKTEMVKIQTEMNALSDADPDVVKLGAWRELWLALDAGRTCIEKIEAGLLKNDDNATLGTWKY